MARCQCRGRETFFVRSFVENCTQPKNLEARAKELLHYKLLSFSSPPISLRYDSLTCGLWGGRRLHYCKRGCDWVTRKTDMIWWFGANDRQFERVAQKFSRFLCYFGAHEDDEICACLVVERVIMSFSSSYSPFLNKPLLFFQELHGIFMIQKLTLSRGNRVHKKFTKKGSQTFFHTDFLFVFRFWLQFYIENIFFSVGTAAAACWVRQTNILEHEFFKAMRLLPHFLPPVRNFPSGCKLPLLSFKALSFFRWKTQHSILNETMIFVS